MAEEKGPRKSPAPIFIVADDNREAAERLVSILYPADCFFLPIFDPRQVVRYTREIVTTAVLLADRVAYARGGSGRLLQEILDETGVPVIILAEDWTPENVERWKRMGARACIPHPTRTEYRIEILLALIREFLLGHYRGEAAAPQVNSPDENRR